MSMFDNAPTQLLSRSLGREDPINAIVAIDTSNSVKRHMPAINAGLARIRDIVCRDPRAAVLTNIAVVTFDSEVRVRRLRDEDGSAGLPEAEAAFVPARDLPRLELTAQGSTSLNKALLKVVELEREQCRRQFAHGLTPKQSQVFILSDGVDFPGGDVEEGARAIDQAQKDGKMRVYFLGFGDFDRAVAGRIAATSGGFFEAPEDAPLDDFFELTGLVTRKRSLSADREAVSVPTPIGTGESPIDFHSPQGLTIQEFLAQGAA